MGPGSVMRSPEHVRSGTIWIWVGATHAAVMLALFVLRPGNPWLLVAVTVVGPVWIARGVSDRRTRVELTGSGVDVHTPGAILLNHTAVRWVDVQELRIDPPGGPRQIRLRLASGRDVALPPLRDPDTDDVRCAYEAASRDRDGRYR